MFEQFSSGYYLGRLFVSPDDGDRVTMCRTQHERVNRQLYAEDEGIEPLDRPLVMKMGSTHFAVHGDEGVPADTLAMPRQHLEASGVRNPPTLREVLLAKAERTRQLLPYTDAEPAESATAGVDPDEPAGI